MIPTYRIFLSCVSKEFRGYRDELRGQLSTSVREIKVQEDFVDGGGTLLSKLDDYITSCQAMIHLVGEGCGCMPKPAEVRGMLECYPDLPLELPELAGELTPDGCSFTYTQWEVVLAIYHRVDCFIYLAEEGSRRESGWTATPADARSQTAHRRRLRELGQDRKSMPFKDVRDVAIRFLNAIAVPSTSLADDAITSRADIRWPDPPTAFEYPLADREREIGNFIRLITGQTAERIYLISGPSDRGKTVLVGQFVELARHMGIQCAHEEFKNAVPLPEVLWDLTRDLASQVRFPRFQREHPRGNKDALRTSFLQDLDEARVPVVLILDTYQDANEETKRWIEDRLLPHLRRHDGLRLVLAGKTVPDPVHQAWGTLAMHQELPPIPDVAPWQNYTQRVLGMEHPEEHIRLLVDASLGSPRVLASLLANLKQARV